MKALGYIGAFLGGAIAGSALGLIFAPEKGEDTRSKIADAVDNFCSKHNIKLSKKDVDDLDFSSVFYFNFIKCRNYWATC